MRLHVETLFACDDEGRLTAVNEAGGGPAPRLFLGLTAHGLECRFRADLDASVVAELGALIESAALGGRLDPDGASLAPVLRRLGRDGPVRSVWAGPAFRFPQGLGPVTNATRVTPWTASVLDRRFLEWKADVSADVPFWAALDQGDAVSICCSVGMTGRAHCGAPRARTCGVAVPATKLPKRFPGHYRRRKVGRAL